MRLMRRLRSKAGVGMRIAITAVGRLKRAPEEELSRDYLGRISKLGRQIGITDVVVKEIPESTAGSAAQRKTDEARSILSKQSDRAIIIALDEHGPSMDSIAFSRLIKTCLEDGTADLTFVIGGPDGLEPALLKNARQRVCFGKLTWPHRLVRVMLAEQIYRAVTILVNHPYHRA
jgi:23S rRNA (pseudouridine1915-N3)-methyltransferase